MQKGFGRRAHDHQPLQVMSQQAVIQLALMGQLIYRKYRVRLTKTSVSRVMKVLEYTPQKPKYVAWQQDRVLVESWKTKLYPALKAEAKTMRLSIYFADESGIRSDHRAGTT